MKSYKELLNELANRKNTTLRELTLEESICLKEAILNIYKDVAKICEENGLTIMLCGGSCLGAIRHKGFIPWDDDLDVLMPRADYNKFKKLCDDGLLGGKYEYTYPSSNKDSISMFMKIFRKDTLNIELGSESTPFPKGIFLDIFILDGTPNNKLLSTAKGYIANILRLISNMVLSSQYPSQSWKEFVSLDKTLYRNYQIRFFLGKLFSIISHKHWVYWFDKFVSNDNKTDYLTIPTGRKLYKNERLEASIFLPAKESTFEGLKVYIPNNHDKYLKNLYGNYMQIPPVEKRERHFIIQFSLPKIQN